MKKLVLSLLLLALTGCSAQTTKSTTTSTAPTQTTSATQATTNQSVQSSAEKLPADYSQALQKAKAYAHQLHLSKQALYAQLTSAYGEHFSPAAADYALAHLKMDWKQNALVMARTYATDMHLAKAAIYDQLTAENGDAFTATEAQFAIDHLKTDWNKNALLKAREYQKEQLTAPEIKERLVVTDKFTEVEAADALQHLNE